ncbi:MAG: hypothetical protein A2017_21290 [Lentisphaerae bacterium GWF2_44_16]|nr:MAG: hypothetical protein A2017_21290 [Lentisphaerae bacterium GWF2_44_16]
MMKHKSVYIVVDIEGIAGVVFYEYRSKEMSMLNYELLHRNRVLMTEEVNAAARGAFEGGAEKVLVLDHHGAGYNIMPELIDERIELIHGRSEQHFTMGMHHPDMEETDALILLGMHAKAGTVNGSTPHSLLYTKTDGGEIYKLSEATMSMALAGDCGIPCLFIAGDKATVEDALELSPKMKYVITKKHFASQVARTIAPALSRKLIQKGVKEALKNTTLKPFIIKGPCTIRIGDRNPDVLWPEKPEKRNTFTEALDSTIRNVPWYKPIDKIDDGWRYPDRTHPVPDTEWNIPKKKSVKKK